MRNKRRGKVVIYQAKSGRIGFRAGELDKKSTVSILGTVQKEANRQVARKMEYYSLDAILSVGYRGNSKQATQFRIPANVAH